MLEPSAHEPRAYTSGSKQRTAVRVFTLTMNRDLFVTAEHRNPGFSRVARHVLPWLQPHPQARWKHRTGYQNAMRSAFQKYRFATCTCTSARASEFWKTAFWHMWTELNFSIHAPNTCAASSIMHPHLCECLPIRGFSSRQKTHQNDNQQVLASTNGAGTKPPHSRTPPNQPDTDHPNVKSGRRL